MSLVECCKTAPGYIFSATDSRLKWLVNILIFHFLFLKEYHRHNQMIQFWCEYASDSEEDKEDLIEVEAMPITVYDSSGDEDVSRFALMII